MSNANIFVGGIGQDSIERAKALLTGISKGAEKAINSALKRAAKSGESYSSKVIREEYLVSAGDYKKYSGSKSSINSDFMGTSIQIKFSGHHIPLLRFDSKANASGIVSARVKRSSTRTVLDQAFVGVVNNRDESSHAGIFERRTSKRLPIEEKFGPSIPQMLSANDDIKERINDKVRDVFDERLNHEILAVLNGWRK